MFEYFKRMLPTGRAFSTGPVGDSLIHGTVDHLDRATAQIDSFITGVVPSQTGYGGEWLQRHERVFDIPVNSNDSIADRIARVRARFRRVDPNETLISRSALQAEIDANGWAGVLFIHENPSGLLPQDVLPVISTSNQLGDSQLGDEQLGGVNIGQDYPYLYGWYQLGDYQLQDAQLQDGPVFNNKIANYLDRHKDTFANLSPLAHTFYVCGAVLGEVVTLPAGDEMRLRQLLLTIKPASNVGFLLINYI